MLRCHTAHMRSCNIQPTPPFASTNSELILTTDPDDKKKTLDRFPLLCHDTQS
jgi:hypothetical protein